jgi:hypothetical protein
VPLSGVPQLFWTSGLKAMYTGTVAHHSAEALLGAQCASRPKKGLDTSVGAQLGK